MPFTSRLKSARLTDSSVANTIDNKLGELEADLCNILGLTIDYDYTTVQMVLTSQMGAVSGIATLDGSQKVVQHSAWEGVANGVATLDGSVRIPTAQMPTNLDADTVDSAHATTTPAAGKIPVADGSNKIALGWLLTGSGNGLDADMVDGKHAGSASGLATLDGSSKVLQDPVNATATPTASKIPIADGTGKLAVGWLPSTVDADTVDGFHAATASATLTIPVALATHPTPPVAILHAPDGSGHCDPTETFSYYHIDYRWLPHGDGYGINADCLDNAHGSINAVASCIPIADGSGKIDVDYLPIGHGNGIDADTVDTKHADSTPTATTIPIALGTGKLHMDWLNYSSTKADGKLPVGTSPYGILDHSWISLPRVKAKRTTNQTISAGSWGCITYADEDIDTDGFHDTGTNPSRLTIPTGHAGTFMVFYAATVTASGEVSAQAQVRKNADGDITAGTALYDSWQTVYTLLFDSDYKAWVHGMFIVDLAVSDRIELFIDTHSGTIGSINVNPAYFGLMQISPQLV